jgi:hypothetical protein
VCTFTPNQFSSPFFAPGWPKGWVVSEGKVNEGEAGVVFSPFSKRGTSASLFGLAEEGVFLKIIEYTFDHSISAYQNIGICKTQYPQALTMQTIVPGLILYYFLRRKVLAAVNFNYQLGGRAKEINDIVINYSLSGEHKSLDLVPS